MNKENNMEENGNILYKVKVCPVCKKNFHCFEKNIELCQCSKIVMSSTTREYIRAYYENCLCVECLQDIINERKQKE